MSGTETNPKITINATKKEEGCTTWIRKLLSNLLIIFFTLSLLIFLTIHNTKKVIVIPNATMPEDLKKRGLTGEVFSRNLTEKIYRYKTYFSNLDVKLFEIKNSKKENTIPLSDFNYSTDWYSGIGFNLTIRPVVINSSRSIFRLNPKSYSIVESEVFLRDDHQVMITFRVTKSPLPGFIPSQKFGPMKIDEINDSLFEKAAIYVLSYIDPVSLTTYFLENGNTDKAAKSASIFSNHFPEKFQASYFYASTLYKNGQFLKSGNEYMRTYELENNFSGALYSASFSYLIHSASDKINSQFFLNKAANSIEQFLEIRPWSSDGWNILGNIQRYKGDYSSAHISYLESLCFNSKDKYALENITRNFLASKGAIDGLHWLNGQNQNRFDPHSFWCSRARFEFALSELENAKLSAEQALLFMTEQNEKCLVFLNKACEF